MPGFSSSLGSRIRMKTAYLRMPDPPHMLFDSAY